MGWGEELIYANIIYHSYNITYLTWGFSPYQLFSSLWLIKNTLFLSSSNSNWARNSLLVIGLKIKIKIKNYEHKD